MAAEDTYFFFVPTPPSTKQEAQREAASAEDCAAALVPQAPKAHFVFLLPFLPVGRRKKAKGKGQVYSFQKVFWKPHLLPSASISLARIGSHAFVETNHRRVDKEKGIADGMWGSQLTVSAVSQYNCAEC